jgi:hypothetical protein
VGTLQELQDWYDSQCDGDWEHTWGVQIETIDNPGWHVRIDLNDTALDGLSFEPVVDIEPEREWMRCEVRGSQFVGAGGPQQLERILRTFLDWVRAHDTGSAPTRA